MADVTVTASGVAPIDGNTVTDSGVAGETITAGQPVYRNPNDSNKFYKTDANLSLAAAQVVGIALHAALAGQPLKIAIGGDLTFGSGLTAAIHYICSATAGGIAPVADLTTGWYSSAIGIATSASVLRIKLNVSNVAAA